MSQTLTQLIIGYLILFAVAALANFFLSRGGIKMRHERFLLWTIVLVLLFGTAIDCAHFLGARDTTLWPVNLVFGVTISLAVGAVGMLIAKIVPQKLFD